jgi:alpha-glucosidase (family GH31 glycosyl hydrolase)
MSIRLWSGGLLFSAYNPSESQSFFFREVSFDPAVPYLTSLKELFFTNECFTWTYKRSYVLCLSPQYTLAPCGWIQDKQRLRFLSFNFSSPEKRSLSNRVEDENMELIFGLNEEIYEFCARSLINPIFMHHATSQLTLLKKQSRNGATNQMFVVLHHKIVDISCFSDAKLLFVNSFEFEHQSDLLYYILYIWKQIELDQLNDYIFLAGESGLCNRINQALQTYIRHIGRVEIPAKAYWLGGDILQAPIDLMLLSVCE